MKPRILLVDDDQDVLQGTRLRMDAAGFESIEAHDGRECVSSAVQQQPDAILMDVRMPEMNGLEALTELQREESTRHIPVVMLSASIVDEKKALDAGARYFIRKPYQGISLVAAVRTALKGAETTQPCKPLPVPLPH